MPLARLCGCAGSSEPSLVACARVLGQPKVKHDAEAYINHFSSWFVRLCVRVMIHRNHLMCKTHNTIS